MLYNSIDKIINDNVFIKFHKFCEHIDVFLKIEGMNTGGSIKMKTAAALIQDAIDNKGLNQSKRFIESSSGNLGVALSVIAAAKRFHFICVVDKNTSRQNIKMMRALGTQIVIIEQKDDQGGYLANRLAYIKEATSNDPDLVWLNQYQNRSNPNIHAKMTAKSILNEFKKVDYLFIGAGTTGTLVGCAQYFHQHSPETKLIAVDSIGSITFGTPSQARYLPGLGSSIQPYFFQKNLVDRMIQVPETETITMCREIALRFGYVGGASTGTVLAAVKYMQKDILKKQDATIVVISPDLGTGYLDTVYNDEWCDQTYGSNWKTINKEIKDIGYAG